jgi:D-sedoheptulose 7-phosphate isomerase
VKPYEYLIETAQESMNVRETFIQEYAQKLVEAAHVLGQCIQAGGKVLIFGNGGSAADSQHMAAEMVGRMLMERRPLPAIALSTDTSNLTAIGNDYGYDQVFLRQVQGLADKGDVVVAISTSGNSKNVILAVEEAQKRGCKVIGLTGGAGGKLKDISDIALNVRLGKNSSRIQETHIFAIHSMVDMLDRFFLVERKS